MKWERVGGSRIWQPGEGGGAVCIIAEPECRFSSDIQEVRVGSSRWSEAMQNGQLIEAAPDLLEACKGVGEDGQHVLSTNLRMAANLIETNAYMDQHRRDVWARILRRYAGGIDAAIKKAVHK